MLEKMEKVLKLLSDAGLTLNLKKCQFVITEVEFLGYTVSEKGIQPGRRKLQAILDFPIPTNVQGVRMFIGLASFFRRFTPVCKDR